MFSRWRDDPSYGHPKGGILFIAEHENFDQVHKAHYANSNSHFESRLSLRAPKLVEILVKIKPISLLPTLAI